MSTRRVRLIALAAGVALLGLSAQVAYRAAVTSPDATDLVPAVVTAVGSVARDIALVPDTTRIKGLIPQRTTLTRCCAATAWPTTRPSRWCRPPGACSTRAGCGRCSRSRSSERSRAPSACSSTRSMPTPSCGSRRPLAAARRGPPSCCRSRGRLEHAVTAGRIDRDTPSLFQAMDAAGEGDQLAVDLAGIFGGEVDFNTELQPGDGFALAFERYTREGGATTYGDITAAEFRNDGRVLRAIRFAPPGGKPGYYDETGRSLRRFFLRSPLKFEPRITSRYSSSRRASRAAHGARASRHRLRRASRRAGDCRRRRRGDVGDPRRHQRPHGAIAPCHRVTSHATCTCRRSPPACARERAWSRATRSASSAPRASPLVRTCTTR